MAMLNPLLHLLAIPREIRDQIYSYLHKDLELRTVSRLGRTQVIFGLTNAPYTSVLLTHSRLHDEYKECQSFKNLAASVTNIDHFADLWTWLDDAENKLQDNAALLHVKHVMLRFTHVPNMNVQTSTITDLLDALGPKTPSLETIMIGEFKHLEKFNDITLPKDLNFPAPDKLPPLPYEALSLRLIQRADCRWFHSFYAARTPEKVTHSFFQVRMHTFSSRRLCKRLWTPDELQSSRTPPGYPRLLEKVVREYEASMVEQRPRRIVGWLEECLEAGCRAS